MRLQLISLGLLMILVQASSRTSAAEVAAPVAPAYAAERTMLPTDDTRLEWKDAARGRVVPVKIYSPAVGDGPFPVIVFSHGLGGTREGYEYLGRQWAANGYFVMHVQHIGSDDSAWRGQASPMQAMRRAASLQNAIDRPKDISFAVERLIAMNQSGEKFKGQLDLDRLAVAGHSFGAQTAMLIAGQKLGMAAGGQNALADRRFKTVLAMSESVPLDRGGLDDTYSNVTIPTFFMTGTEDNSPLGDTKADERRLPFDHTRAHPTFLLTIVGGDHMVFSGRLGAARPHDAEDQAIIRQISTAFFDAYLKQDGSAKQWLEKQVKSYLAANGTIEQKP